MQLNSTIVNFVLLDRDLHFQGQAFSCYAIAVKKCADSRFPWQICLVSVGFAVKLLLFFCSLRQTKTITNSSWSPPGAGVHLELEFTWSWSPPRWTRTLKYEQACPSLSTKIIVITGHKPKCLARGSI